MLIELVYLVFYLSLGLWLIWKVRFSEIVAGVSALILAVVIFLKLLGYS